MKMLAVFMTEGEYFDFYIVEFNLYHESTPIDIQWSTYINTSEREQRQTTKSPRTESKYLRVDSPKEGADVRKLLLGEVLPIIMITVLLVNILMLIVFYRGNFRHSTHMILISIAIADSLHGLFFLVPSMHFYTFNNDQDFVPFAWCLVHLIFQVISRVSHGSSLFYTVFLAVHRYVSVRLPLRAKTLCCRKYTFVVICVIPVASVLVHLPLILRLSTYYGAYTTSLLNTNKTINACAQGEFNFSTLIMIWIPNLFAKILPIAILIVISILLIIELRLAAKNIKHLTTGQEEKIQKRNKQNRRITLLTVAVILCVLFTEVPGFIAHIVIRYSSAYSCSICALLLLSVVNKLTIIVFFPANFLIYCLVISRFRKTLLGTLLCVAVIMPLCCVSKCPRDLARSISTTQSTVYQSTKKISSTAQTEMADKH